MHSAIVSVLLSSPRLYLRLIHIHFIYTRYQTYFLSKLIYFFNYFTCHLYTYTYLLPIYALFVVLLCWKLGISSATKVPFSSPVNFLL